LTMSLDSGEAQSARGSWTASADLVLKTQPDVEPGSYTSVITLSLFEDALCPLRPSGSPRCEPDGSVRLDNRDPLPLPVAQDRNDENRSDSHPGGCDPLQRSDSWVGCAQRGSTDLVGHPCR